MRITRRTDYALHLLAELAAQPGCCLGLRKLAADHGVTYAFARTVQQGLLQAGIIEASRGINGGIRLAKTPEEITVLEVFEAAQNPLEETFAATKASWCCCSGQSCMTDGLWLGVREAMRGQFSGVTVKQLLATSATGQVKADKG
ncbi:MAG: Rrf2 family transcriptional regulator [Coriobacteriales bacterium]|jgi:Rrf2 family protein|nr:Rrf2 family transcriptional regulator [Coriobacteriales bacterium]